MAARCAFCSDQRDKKSVRRHSLKAGSCAPDIAWKLSRFPLQLSSLHHLEVPEEWSSGYTVSQSCGVMTRYGMS